MLGILSSSLATLFVWVVELRRFPWWAKTVMNLVKFSLLHSKPLAESNICPATKSKEDPAVHER